MKNVILNGVVLSVVIIWQCAAAPSPTPVPKPPKKLSLGTLKFDVDANVKAFNISGEAKKIEGEAVFTDTAIEKLEARVPVESLTTRMSLRDRHMRERIFQTKDGKLPDLKFVASKTQCASPSAQERKCPLTGTLEIQGVAKPFNLPVEIKQEGTKFKGIGKGTVKLSDYGIPQPEQLGIKVANEVRLEIQLVVE